MCVNVCVCMCVLCRGGRWGSIKTKGRDKIMEGYKFSGLAWCYGSKKDRRKISSCGSLLAEQQTFRPSALLKQTTRMTKRMHSLTYKHARATRAHMHHIH